MRHTAWMRRLTLMLPALLIAAGCAASAAPSATVPTTQTPSSTPPSAAMEVALPAETATVPPSERFEKVRPAYNLDIVSPELPNIAALGGVSYTGTDFEADRFAGPYPAVNGAGTAFPLERGPQDFRAVFEECAAYPAADILAHLEAIGWPEGERTWLRDGWADSGTETAVFWYDEFVIPLAERDVRVAVIQLCADFQSIHSSVDGYLFTASPGMRSYYVQQADGAWRLAYNALTPEPRRVEWPLFATDEGRGGLWLIEQACGSVGIAQDYHRATWINLLTCTVDVSYSVNSANYNMGAYEESVVLFGLRAEPLEHGEALLVAPRHMIMHEYVSEAYPGGEDEKILVLNEHLLVFTWRFADGRMTQSGGAEIYALPDDFSPYWLHYGDDYNMRDTHEPGWLPSRMYIAIPKE